MSFKLVVEKGGGKRRYSCADCGKTATYFDRYDTFACTACDQWLDLCGACATAGEKCPFPTPPRCPSLVDHEPSA